MAYTNKQLCPKFKNKLLISLVPKTGKTANILS